MAFGKHLLLIAFSLLFFGMAYAVPGIPHQFYGSVAVNGAPADGALIVAKINNIEVARTTSSNGTYGYDPYIFYVPDPNGTNSGKTIDFYLSGTKVASKAFETGATTRLDLSIGTAPVCGDGTCNGSETCSTCEADCGGCGGGSLGGGGSGGGGGGGGTPALVVKVEGSCVGQPVVVTVLNTVGNPARGAKVLVSLDGATVEEKVTPADGKASFTLLEAGDYTFYVTKNLYSQTTKTASIKQCAAGEETAGQETGEQGQGEAIDLCESVDCDDSNPCTTEICSSATGHCIYNNQANGTVCSAKGVCNAGVCEQPVENGVGAGLTGVGTGLFGLVSGQAVGAGIIIIALVAGILLMLKKKKKK